MPNPLKLAWGLLSEADPNDPYDVWLDSFGDLDESTSGRVAVRRMPVGGTGLRPAGDSNLNWDQEFQNAKNHAARVLAKELKNTPV
jgi:hypothetical protein